MILMDTFEDMFGEGIKFLGQSFFTVELIDHRNKWIDEYWMCLSLTQKGDLFIVQFLSLDSQEIKRDEVKGPDEVLMAHISCVSEWRKLEKCVEELRDKKDYSISSW